MAQRTIHWLHLDVDILNDEKIDVVRSMPEGDSMFVVWVGLLCLAMKCCDGGYLYVTQGIPYTTAHLARIFKLGKSVVDKAIQAFEGLGMLSTHNGTAIEILNFEKHQGINVLERLREISRRSSTRYREKIKNDPNDAAIKEESKSKRGCVTVTSPLDAVQQGYFDEFWSLYPKKVGKKPAREKWRKLSPNEKLFGEIMRGLEKYIVSEQWMRDNGQFIPHPTTFLNQRRWEDEIESGEKAWDEF